MVADRRPVVIAHNPGNAAGLRRIIAPGLQQSGDWKTLQKPGYEEFALTMETLNGTGMGATCEYLKSTDAHVGCVQETWVVQCEVAKWSGWAFRK